MMQCFVCQRDLSTFSKRRYYEVGVPFVPERGYSDHHRVCPFCFNKWEGDLKWERLQQTEGVPEPAQPHKRRIAKLSQQRKTRKRQRASQKKGNGNGDI